MIRRPSAPILWAFSATVAAASSTVIYLLLARGKPWAPSFIELYSTMGMVAGWMNALIYYISPRSTFFQGRRGAALCMIIAVTLTLFFFRLIFDQPIHLGELVFVFAGLIPILYANAFGLEFYEGNYPWVYKRVVLYNMSILAGAMLAFVFHPTQAGLFYWTGAVGLLWLLIWANDQWNHIDRPAERPLSIRPWLNPSLPILERTLWDQWVLARLGALQWSLGIYLIGRIITFSGNVVYSYLLGTNSKAHRRQDGNPVIAWVIIAVALPLALLGLRFAWCAFLLGQLFSWLITTELSSEYESGGSIYGKFLLIWALDLGWRVAALLLSSDPYQYGRLAVSSGLFGIIAVMIILRKRPAWRLREKTNTKLQPADFLNIH